ncbi:type ISP restriction/modification enzyme, partial [uncultured Sphingomonas sp.]|uniref:type ISP restriction/modification enzyme n=1 Tax=uncultured Sphingomonas sp. TaxID=158754 RepID=UPI003749EEBF
MRAISGSQRESVLREAFKDLLKRWGKAHDLQFVAEHDLLTNRMTRIYVDGALLHSLRVPFGYWEAKDAADDLEAEIQAKFRKGYPRDNIVFTDDRTAVLWQDGAEVLRAGMQADDDSLLALLTRFFAHERREIADFNRAVKKFAADLPHILVALRERIAEKHAASQDFADAVAAFLKHARDAINPAVSDDDVREMLIQHILTEDIFAKVFNDPDFHRKNNVAAELYKLEDTLFDRGEKRTLLGALAPYYAGIEATAALIESHSEKQGFLKALYEDFYKAYNRKAADRLGVVYTPGEIVRFMIRSADWLCEKHFGKNLIDRGVEILDPATGTGTFIVELLEHFRGNHDKLRHKYKEELHANEVAILPYYVANLNIEATYQAITGQFAEYENLCFVDTLDNVAALGIYSGHQFDLLGGLADENMERVKRQNRRKISVIIGNPPYNAWQENYNQNNANRPYERVDQRIKQTYVHEGTAQNMNSVYDMYTRFVRWASDRIGDEGIIAFVIGRKPIAKAAYDGFRKVAEREFSDIWLLDLGGDVRDNPKLSGTTHNVFGIQTGVMVALLVKRKGKSGAVIRYARRPDMETAADKLAWIGNARSFEGLPVETIVPDKRHDWVDQASGDWSNFLPLANPEAGPLDASGNVRAIFRLSSNGLQTKRNDWVWASDEVSLSRRVQTLIAAYEHERTGLGAKGPEVKWDADLARGLKRSIAVDFSEDRKTIAQFRPYTRHWLYLESNLISRMFRQTSFFPGGVTNPSITVRGVASQDPLTTLATDRIYDLDLLKTGNGVTAGVARYRYLKSGERVDNITDWALNKFVARYGKKGVGKDTIFTYVYAVLHDPVYRETYALNLKREFPRIPFYPDFARWS